MSDPKTVLTPEQIAELKAARAAIDGPFSTASSMPREQAYARDVYLKLLEAHAPALLDAAERCGERDDLARRLGEATAALLALRKWVDEYSDLVERSKRWVHDSTMWETSSYPELAKEWQALWSRCPESVIDINTTPPADLAAVRGACALALRWLGDPDDPNGTFEDIGAWYQRETGRLRPGKSLPMAMAGVSDEDREKHFCAWADAKGREVRAALKSAGGASRTERGDHAKGGG